MKSTEKTLSLNAKLLSLLLALLLAFSVVFTGCGKKDTPNVPDPGENGENTGDTGETGETEDPAEEEFTVDENATFALITDGKPVRIVRSINSVTGNADLLAAEKIRRGVARLCGNVTVETDFSITGELDADTPEVLVGFTAYPESATAAKGVGYGDYVIRLVGKKLCVIAYTDVGYKAAGDFLEELIGTLGEKDAKNVTLTAKYLAYRAIADETFATIPALSSSSVKSCVPEIGVDELIVSDVELAEYDGFVKRMKTNGYTVYVENVIGENKFATFTSKTTTVNAGFYGKVKEARITLQAYDAKQLPAPESENKYETVTTPLISILGLKYDTGNNGMSMLIRLCDGRFVVIDGGFRRQETADNLLNAMKNQSKAYAKDGKVTVAAWILTHGHYDHVGVFTNYASYLKSNGVTVERAFTNRLSETSITQARAAYPDTFEDSEGQSNTALATAAKTFGCPLITVHAGQEFYFADMTMQVLATFENIAPNNLRDLNASSIVSMLIFKDNGKTAKVFVTGDATGDELRTCATNYAELLACDIVQPAHHGGEPYHDSEGTSAAYGFAKPAYVFWATSESAANSRAGYSYNTVLTNKINNPNFKQSIAAGNEGEIKSFSLNAA